jgi:hypothetical protein
MSGSTILSEGGNVFKDKDGNSLTTRIVQADIPTTVKFLEKITGLDLSTNIDSETKYPSRWLGSTGKKSDSGDLDLGVDSNEISKQQLVDKLSKWATSNNLDPAEYVKARSEVHFKTPIKGNPKNGFVQTDFMFFPDINWGEFYYGGGYNTNYKGVYRNILMSSIAKAQGLKIGSNGVISRTTNNVITTDPDYAAELLLGKGKTKKDLINVETIYKNIQSDPDRNEKLKDFEELLRKEKLEPPSVSETQVYEAKIGSTEWFRALVNKIS